MGKPIAGTMAMKGGLDYQRGQVLDIKSGVGSNPSFYESGVEPSGIEMTDVWEDMSQFKIIEGSKENVKL